MRKRTVGSAVAVCMLVAFSFYFIGGTYARYTTDFTGTAKLNVAKWATKVKDGAAESTDLTLNFTTEENPNVVSGKIAPDVTATAKAEIDLEGTEVAVDVLLKSGEGSIEDAVNTAVADLGMKASDIKFELEVKLEGDEGGSKVTETTPGEEYKITLPDAASGFTDGNSIVTVNLKVTWTNNDTNSADDTAAGKKAGELSIPVKVTVQQHID